MRLTCGIDELNFRLNPRRVHDEVLGCRDTRFDLPNPVKFRLLPWGTETDIIPYSFDIHSSFGKHTRVRLDRPHPQVASARKRHLGNAETSQKRSDKIKRCSEVAPQFLVHSIRVQILAVYLYFPLAVISHPSTHLLDNSQQFRYIRSPGNIFIGDCLRGKYRRRNHCHYRVLIWNWCHLTLEPPSTRYPYRPIHVLLLYQTESNLS